MLNKKSIILSIIFLFGFAIICFIMAINDGSPLEIDFKIQDFMLKHRSDMLSTILKLVTALSNPKFIIGFIAILLILPFTRKKIGVPVAVSESIIFAIYSVIKVVFGRLRPDDSLMLVNETTASFPSGHAITSVIVYGLLIYLIRQYIGNKIMAQIVSIFFALLIVTIGISRVYLCAHWATDVVAGWLLALSFLVIVLNALKHPRIKAFSGDEEQIIK